LGDQNLSEVGQACLFEQLLVVSRAYYVNRVCIRGPQVFRVEQRYPALPETGFRQGTALNKARASTRLRGPSRDRPYACPPSAPTSPVGAPGRSDASVPRREHWMASGHEI